MVGRKYNISLGPGFLDTYLTSTCSGDHSYASLQGTTLDLLLMSLPRQERSLRINSASHFQRLFQLVVDSAELELVGLTIVPQEGKDAGRTNSTFAVRKGAVTPDVSKICRHCAEMLFHRQPHERDKFDISNYIKIPLSGQFGTEIGFLWFLKRSVPSNEIQEILVEHILTSIEDSKKSYFHDIFISSISSYDRGTLYERIANSIRAGVYCDDVVLWRRQRGLLKSINVGGLDVSISNSVAGRAISEGFVRIPDFRALGRNELQHPDYIKSRDLHSAFFFKFSESEVDSQNNGIVVGVFYHRPYGTTDLDRILCQYAIDYYRILWAQKNEIEALSNRASEFEHIGPFYRDAISALVDFHDLTAIHSGLAGALSDAEVLSASRPELREKIVLAKARLRELRKLVEKNRSALTIAPDYLEIANSTGDSEARLCDIRALFENEINLLEDEVHSYRARIVPRFNLPFSYAIVAERDYRRVLTNLLTNAMRSIKYRSQGGGRIVASANLHGKSGKIELTVEDNGMGIQAENISKIFDVHYSTHQKEGGKGIGLAVVKAIARRHGSLPIVESTWGHGAKFAVSLNYRER